MKKILFVLCPVAVLALIVSAMNIHSKASESTVESYEQYYTKESFGEDSNGTVSEGSVLTNKNHIGSQTSDDTDRIDLNPSSVTVLVNKSYTLDPDYEPDDLVVPNIKFSFSNYDDKMQLRKEAASAMENLFNAGLEEGVALAGVSGYRSYKRQFEIYVTNLIRRGIDFTNQYSAMPGASEHQTGLAMDISTASIQYRLSDSFATTKEGIWVANNCHKYGFVVRFQKDKTDKTGYSYEPWHIRYVGIELATYLTENNLTLDEYYGYEYDDQIYASVDYNEIIRDYYEMKGIASNNTTYLGNSNQSVKPNNDTMDDYESLEEDLIEGSTGTNSSQNHTSTGNGSGSVTNRPTNTPQKPSTSKPTTDKPSTNVPTQKPTETPTEHPTEEPSQEVIDQPTNTPSDEVTTPPAQAPTETPSQTPSDTPTDVPTQTPSETPSEPPIAEPTFSPIGAEVIPQLPADAVNESTNAVE